MKSISHELTTTVNKQKSNGKKHLTYWDKKINMFKEFNLTSRMKRPVLPTLDPYST